VYRGAPWSPSSSVGDAMDAAERVSLFAAEQQAGDLDHGLCLRQDWHGFWCVKWVTGATIVREHTPARAISAAILHRGISSTFLYLEDCQAHRLTSTDLFLPDTQCGGPMNVRSFPLDDLPFVLPLVLCASHASSHLSSVLLMLPQEASGD
jgi:hypothetical protein